MKSIITLLLVLLFASCGKQEVYEFRQKRSDAYWKYYNVDENGTDVEFISSQRDNAKQFDKDYLRKSLRRKIQEIRFKEENYPQKRQDISITEWVEFKFTPIDEDGFCFYTYRGNIYKNDKSYHRFDIDNERIEKVLFMDEQENVLFTYPFEDSYDNEKRVGNYDVQGKVKSVTRALLERVVQEKIVIKSKFEWEKNLSIPRRKIDLTKLDLSNYDYNSSK